MGGEPCVPDLCLAAKPLVYSVQDGVLYDVSVDLFSSTDRWQLGDHCRQRQRGVVCQRHVTDLHQKDGGSGEVMKIFSG